MDGTTTVTYPQLSNRIASLTLSSFGLITECTYHNDESVNKEDFLNKPIMAFVHQHDLLALFSVLKHLTSLKATITLRWRSKQDSDDYSWIDLEALETNKRIYVVIKRASQIIVGQVLSPQIRARDGINWIRTEAKKQVRHLRSFVQYYFAGEALSQSNGLLIFVRRRMIQFCDILLSN